MILYHSELYEWRGKQSLLIFIFQSLVICFFSLFLSLSYLVGFELRASSFSVLVCDHPTLCLPHSRGKSGAQLMLRWCLANYFAGMALKCSSPDLCLLSSWDNRCDPLHLAHLFTPKLRIQYSVFFSLISLS
jgi:hypothetical protein